MTEHRAIEAAERAAAVMATAGMPRMPARVMMALIAAPEPGCTAAELCERLGISAGAVSGAIRYLQQVHFVQRRTTPGERRERYRLVVESFYSAVTQNTPVYNRAADELETIASESEHDAVRSRALEVASFFRFMARRMPELTAEWRAERGDPAG